MRSALGDGASSRVKRDWRSGGRRRERRRRERRTASIRHLEGARC